MIDIKQPTDAYDLSVVQANVFGVQSTGTIEGHNDVKNAATAWALFNLVKNSS